MKPDYASIISCPYCGQRVEIMSSCTSNSFSMDYYSDQQIVAKNMAHVSPILKCPKCQNYYWTSKQPQKRSNHYSLQLGTLSYADLIAAAKQLQSEEMEKSDEITLCKEIVHAFNDTYYNIDESTMNDEQKQMFNADYQAFQKYALRLSYLMRGNKLLRAELYRECQRYSVCISILETFQSDDKMEMRLRDAIMNKAKRQESDVFLCFSRGYSAAHGSKTRQRDVSPVLPYKPISPFKRLRYVLFRISFSFIEWIAKDVS